MGNFSVSAKDANKYVIALKPVRRDTGPNPIVVNVSFLEGELSPLQGCLFYRLAAVLPFLLKCDCCDLRLHLTKVGCGKKRKHLVSHTSFFR